jgi:hypothetical protein
MQLTLPEVFASPIWTAACSWESSYCCLRSEYACGVHVLLLLLQQQQLLLLFVVQPLLSGICIL